MLVVLASLIAGCFAAAVYVCWPWQNPDPCIKVQPLWAVSGVVFTNDDDNIFEYAAEFAAPTQLDAIRQYGDHVRSCGWWVGGLTDVYRNGVVTVPRKGAKA